MRTFVLVVDAAVNLILGLLLVLFPLRFFQFLGLPIEAPPFYAPLLGGFLVGISAALFMGLRGDGRAREGLGLGGVILINLFAALVLASLLVSGRIYIPLRGYVLMLALVLLLIVLSSIELWIYQKGGERKAEQMHE